MKFLHILSKEKVENISENLQKKNFSDIMNYMNFSMKSRKILIIAIIITLVLLCAIFAVKIFAEKNGKNPWAIIDHLETKILSAFEKERETSVSDTKKYNQALYYSNEVACETISNVEKKSECTDYTLITKYLKNPKNADCNAITNESRRSECANLMLEKTATEAKNKNLCSTIQDAEIGTRCRESIDAKNFSEIVKENSANIQSCSTLEGNFRTECMKLIENYKTEETYIAATTSNNIVRCNLLAEKNLQTKCQDEIIKSLAEKEKNTALCGNIQNGDLRQECVKRTISSRDMQLFEQAASSDNIELCASISDGNIKARCQDVVIIGIVRKTKNASLCNNLINTDSKAICQKIPQS